MWRRGELGECTNRGIGESDPIVDINPFLAGFIVNNHSYIISATIYTDTGTFQPIFSNRMGNKRTTMIGHIYG